MLHRKPPKGPLPPIDLQLDQDWTKDGVSVRNTNNGMHVEVKEEKGTVVITEKGTVMRNGESMGLYHSQKCREVNCTQCLFYHMDEARNSAKDEMIGQGSQGLVYRFYGKDKKAYVRKDVSLKGTSIAPVMSQLLDEQAKSGVAASVEGEVNRLFVRGTHIVTLHGIRLNTACTAPSTSPRVSKNVGNTRQTLEFVMEYMDWTLEALQDFAKLVDQRVLNRIASRCIIDKDPDLGAPHCAVIAASIAAVMASCSKRYSLALYMRSHPSGYRRKCGCCSMDSDDTPKPRIVGRSDYGVLPEPILLNIFKQTACGIERLSQCCIIHKDIKPSNILVDRLGRVKFADFGTSKKGRKDRDTKVTVASPCGMSTRIYKAPELAESMLVDLTELMTSQEKQITAAADIWSLGLTMLVLATPHKYGPWPPEFAPHGGRRDMFYHPVCVNDFRVPASLSEPFSSLLGRCLAHTPSSRPTPLELSNHATLPLRCYCKHEGSGVYEGQGVRMAGFIECLLAVVSPLEEGRKARTKLLQHGLEPVEAAPGPLEFSNWCDDTLRALENLNKFGKSASAWDVAQYYDEGSTSRRGGRGSLHAPNHEVCRDTLPVLEVTTPVVVTPAEADLSSESLKGLHKLHKALRDRQEMLARIEAPLCCEIYGTGLAIQVGGIPDLQEDTYSPELMRPVTGYDRLSEMQHQKMDRKIQKRHQQFVNSKHDKLAPKSAIDGLTELLSDRSKK
eukprot:TRINITY_DN2561_c2_g1_i1.p1 TRINITY_DN2561_c2_g1~~TRINITY_DN2561_c2_g1_i1.p1  ORF type:complete len:730 (+),score=176.07 TRINITY_DN2561_c2_g1_i1:82-2271(+)